MTDEQKWEQIRQIEELLADSHFDTVGVLTNDDARFTIRLAKEQAIVADYFRCELLALWGALKERGWMDADLIEEFRKAIHNADVHRVGGWIPLQPPAPPVPESTP